MVLLLGLTPTTVLAAELKAETENVTITVTMDTQAVAEDATLYGLELLPISTEVTVPTDSTVSVVMRQSAADTGVAVVSADSGFITTIGNFGGKGTAEFTNMCAAAGFDPVPEIFDYAGWTYTINGEMGMGGANTDR